MKDCPDCQKCDCKIHGETIKIKTSGKPSLNRIDVYISPIRREKLGI